VGSSAAALPSGADTRLFRSGAEVARAPLHFHALPPGSPADIAAGTQSFVLGLVVQALFDPAAFPPRRQIKLLDDYLAALTASH